MFERIKTKSVTERISALEVTCQEQGGRILNRAKELGEEFSHLENSVLDAPEKLNRLRQKVEALQTVCAGAAGAAVVAGLAAFVYGLTRHPESAYVAEKIASGGLVGGTIGYLLAYVAEIGNRIKAHIAISNIEKEI